MLPDFAFATASRIVFGRGKADTVADEVAAMGRRVLLVHGRGTERSAGIAAGLAAAGCSVGSFSVRGEPDLPMIEDGVALARDVGVEVVLAVGGGAVIDAGKAIAALKPATRPTLDHLEVVGQGLPLDHAPLPFVAVPTTAGTGAEVTRNAVIGVPEHQRKVSLRDMRMLPELAVVDPALTDGCPWGVTLASGLDAVTQVIEPFVSTRANPMTDALCRDAIPRGLRALRRLAGGEDQGARDDMAWVSLSGGLALANSGLGAVHGLAGPLGGLTGAAHGAICGALLPHVLVANHRVAVEAGRDVARMEQVGRWIGEVFEAPESGIDEAADLLAGWSRSVGLRGFEALGIDGDARAAAAVAAAGSSSMKANPVALSEADLLAVIEAAD